MSSPSASLVLRRDCPSLTGELREELIYRWNITASEAAAINALIREWGEEPNNKMGPGQRARELRRRIETLIGEMRAPLRAVC